MSALNTESGEAALRRAIQDSNQDPIPRDIVLQVSLAGQGSEAFLQRLYREMESYAPLLARDRQIIELCFVGAGLGQLQQAQREELLQSLAQHFAPARTLTTCCGAAQHCDVLGLGLGAVSRFGSCQTRNAAQLQEYCAAIDDGRLPVVESQRLDAP
jgi:coproporphyrinogen III oxidase-like Fe-S oxidoreductase